MTWYLILARTAAGLFLVNGVPHFVHGVSGKPFQSPFATPPGVGESPPLVNVIWGGFNFFVGYILLHAGKPLAGGLSLDAFLVGIGGTAMALLLAWHFDRVRQANK